MPNALPAEARLPIPPRRPTLSVGNAIYSRRAVRNYTDETVPKDAVEVLLYAGVQAPTAMHDESWMFAVIQSRSILKALSDTAGELMAAAGIDMPSRPGADFNIFYNAVTLIVIYGQEDARFATAGCWLAAENIMLAACGMGLGSCVIGKAVDALNTPQWKERLQVPVRMMAVAPIILGVPATRADAVARTPPIITRWVSRDEDI